MASSPKLAWYVSVWSVMFASALSSSASAEIYHVDINAAPGGDGLSWGAAFTQLEDALELAVAGDEVKVAEGKAFPRDGQNQTGITPSIEAVSSEAPPDLVAGNLVDGAGLNGSHPINAAGTMWQSAFGQTSATITLDLEEDVVIGRMGIWNFNHSDVVDLTSRGARDVRVSVSSGPAMAFSEVASFVLEQATGTAGYEGKILDFDPVIARQVRLELLTNHGDSSHIGLSEIQIGPPASTLITSLEVPAGVVLRGGYSSAGGEGRQWDPELYVTILSGDMEGDDPAADLQPSTVPSVDQYSDNLPTVVSLLGDGAVVDGFTIERGYTDTGSGGGVSTQGLTELRNLKIRNNLAELGGGVFASAGPAPIVENCTFERNIARGAGGGYFGPVRELRTCLFSLNRSGLGGGNVRGGGGAYLKSDGLVIDTDFVGNKSSGGRGGGLHVFDGSELTMQRGSFSANSTFQSSGSALFGSNSTLLRLEHVVINGNVTASGVVLSWEELRMKSCTFSQHAEGGTASAISAKICELDDCSFVGNSRGAFGNSPMIAATRLEVRNSRLIDNGYAYIKLLDAGYLVLSNSEFRNNGGMIEGIVELIEGCRFNSNFTGPNNPLILDQWHSAVGLIQNSIFVENDGRQVLATNYPLVLRNVTLAYNTGIAVQAGLDDVTIQNSIVWGNGAAVGTNPFSGSSTNFIIQGLPGAPDPRFVDSTDLRLQADSPAINAGDNSLIEAGELDVSGRRRISDGIVDLGAYEFGSGASDTLVYYDFDDSSEGIVVNRGLGIDGSLNTLSAIVPDSPVAGGDLMMLYCDVTGGSASSHIDTNVLASDMDLLTGADYTMSAWFKMETLSSASPADLIIFGQGSGSVLHHGIRGDQLHFGHWANDSNSGSTTVEAGQWYHAAWVYEGGLQSIYVNGVKVSEEARGPLGQDGNILVGTTLFIRDRDFQGWIDEVMIDDRGWSDADILAQYREGLGQDSDGDGISDVLEENAGGSVDAGSDADGDGASALLEIYSGSDPSDAASVPLSLEVEHIGSELIVRHRESPAGITAEGRIEWSIDGISWQAADPAEESGVESSQRVLETRLPAASGALLARLRVTSAS